MKKLLLLILAAALLAACGGQKPKAARSVMTGHALGTSYKIVIWSDHGVDLHDEIDSLAARADKSMSIFNPESLLSRINRGETDSLDRYLTEVITIARRISDESGGYFDITVKPLVSAYGFGSEDPAVNPDVDSILEFIGYRKIRIDGNRLVKDDPRIQIDLNAIAKGYVVDLVSDYLSSLGYPDHLVEIGGEMSARGLRSDGTPWVISIDAPFEGNIVPGAKTAAYLEFTDSGLATSGNYRRFRVDESGRKYVHTVNPLTGQPEINDMLQATVIAENSTLADGYATMFMAIGFEKSKEFLSSRDDLEALLIYSDDKGDNIIYATQGMKDMLKD